MCVTVCGKFVLDEGIVAGYDNRIQDKGSAKWGVQIAGMFFGARSRGFQRNFLLHKNFGRGPYLCRNFFKYSFFSAVIR